MWNLKYDTEELFTKHRLTGREDKLMFTKGAGGGIN